MSTTDFILDKKQNVYARFVLHLMMLPESLQTSFKDLLGELELFCSYDGQRYRIISATENCVLLLHIYSDAGGLRDIWDCSQFSSTFDGVYYDERYKAYCKCYSYNSTELHIKGLPK